MMHEIDPKLKVFSLACPLFVPLAEEGYIDKEATYLIARDYLQTMIDVMSTRSSWGARTIRFWSM